MTIENQPVESGPVRRPRRATSGVATPSTAPAAPAAETPVATPDPTAPVEAPAAPARARRTRKPATGTPVESAAPELVEAPPAEVAEQAPARARRSRRATAPTAAPTAVPADAAPVVPGEAAPEPSTPEAAPEKPARKAPAKRTRKAAPKAAEAEAAGEPATPATEPAAPAEPAADAEAPRTGRSRRRSTAKTAAAEAATGADAGSTPALGLDVLAELGAPRATTTTGGDQPRLAATALLFQAPDLSTRRPTRRRAQAPAGPPLHVEGSVEEDEETLEATEAVEDLEAIVEDVEAPDEATEDTEDGDGENRPRRRRRRGGRGRRGRSDSDGDDDRTEDAEADTADASESGEDAEETEDGEGDGESGSSSRRRRRRRSRGSKPEAEAPEPSSARTRTRARSASDEVTALKGSTRLEAKRQRRREGRDAGRRRSIITESEFLARRESVERAMVVRELAGRVQIGVLEDGVLVEHFVSRTDQGPSSMVGNVYLGRVQNVLPSMEAAFVDIGKGRNAVLYAGEVNWDAAGLEGQPRRIETALKSGDPVLVQVTKDPIGHKGARLTSQITLAGRYLVYVPGGGMTGISRKLPDTERARLKQILKEIVPEDAGVIVRTAAEGASDEELRRDVARLQDSWATIVKKQKTASAPAMLLGEPDLAIRVVRDIFNDDFSSLVVQADGVWDAIHEYVGAMAPDLADRVSRWTGQGDVFAAHRIDEQLAKGMDRKVWLPSGGSLVIDRTEAMTVVDVNTGKFTGTGGTLEETVTRNNLEAAEEIVRQLRLRDIGGMIVIDFIDMVLESNRDLVLRRLVECLGRDRTKHQVAEVTSLGLVQMTRKRVGQGLVEAFSETCAHCNGRGFMVHTDPAVAVGEPVEVAAPAESKRSRRKKVAAPAVTQPAVPVLPEARDAVNATLAQIAAAAAHAHEAAHAEPVAEPVAEAPDPVVAEAVAEETPADVVPDAPTSSDAV